MPVGVAVNHIEAALHGGGAVRHDGAEDQPGVTAVGAHMGDHRVKIGVFQIA